MGASRKLQGEIDRVLKKVQEGVDVFDSIWNKVYDTENANQKEKFEADLKKEIKKLQRYRDQIKTWIQSSEIKDKKVSASYEQALMDARKQIEREMERFKICEKETKTKAFSKEGLGQQPKTDPKEKAKSETRDWLNNVVSELENQIDIFEAEMEGLTVKKGKTRPPRLTHLETSIVRHKAHIMKLELILRLLDNDELSPEQVNDVKDFLDDYVDRNQEDFDEFDDVDELYSSLPLDKVESLEDLVIAVPPALVKGVSSSTAVLSVKPSLDPTSAIPATALTPIQVDEAALQDTNSDSAARSPPPKSSSLSSSAPQTPPASHTTPSITSALSITPPTILSNATEREETNFTGPKSSPALVETGLRAFNRVGLPSQPSPTVTIPPSPSNIISSSSSIGSVSLASEIGKRSTLASDDQTENTTSMPQSISPLSNRMILSQVPKASDGRGSPDTGILTDAATLGSRVFTSPVAPSMQWRTGSSFQNQNETVRGRTEIAPDQREQFLQRYHQQVQQGQTNPLGMPPLGGGKQYSTQQPNPLLQQFNAQSSSITPQLGLGIGVQTSGLSSVASAASSQQQPSAFHQLSNQQTVIPVASTETENSFPTKAEELKQQSVTEDPPADSGSSTSGIGKNLVPEDELKASYAADPPQVGVTIGSLELSQAMRDTDFSPGLPLQSNQSAGSLGVIGRKSVSDVGAIGDSMSASTASAGVMHDQLYNLQMLEAAYYRLPQPKDSERAKTYISRHPTVTPSSYPQVQAPIVNNPAFWERLGADTFGTDTLFFSFYYQQNTYQQYLAAKELRKQSWRYHRKYNTWFQRHEEPKITTDDFEQGTYVYFDFHIASDEQHGWCQRIKTEFTFEYNYLEDELN